MFVGKKTHLVNSLRSKYLGGGGDFNKTRYYACNALNTAYNNNTTTTTTTTNNNTNNNNNNNNNNTTNNHILNYNISNINKLNKCAYSTLGAGTTTSGAEEIISPNNSNNINKNLNKRKKINNPNSINKDNLFPVEPIVLKEKDLKEHGIVYQLTNSVNVASPNESQNEKLIQLFSYFLKSGALERAEHILDSLQDDKSVAKDVYDELLYNYSFAFLKKHKDYKIFIDWLDGRINLDSNANTNANANANANKKPNFNSSKISAIRFYAALHYSPKETLKEYLSEEKALYLSLSPNNKISDILLELIYIDPEDAHEVINVLNLNRNEINDDEKIVEDVILKSFGKNLKDIRELYNESLKNGEQDWNENRIDSITLYSDSAKFLRSNFHALLCGNFPTHTKANEYLSKLSDLGPEIVQFLKDVPNNTPIQNVIVYQDLLEKVSYYPDEVINAFDDLFYRFNSQRQYILEIMTSESAVEKGKHLNELSSSASANFHAATGRHTEINALMYQWHKDLTQKIIQKIQKIDDIMDKKILNDKEFGKNAEILAPFFKLLRPEQFSIIAIIEVLKPLTDPAPDALLKTGKLSDSVSNSIRREYYVNNVLPPSARKITSVKTISKLLRREVKNRKITWDIDWPPKIRVQVACYLLQWLIEVAKMELKGTDPTTGKEVYQSLPVLSHSYVHSNGQVIGTIKLHPHLLEKLSSESIRVLVHPKEMPMLVPPLPWTDYNSGGLYCTPTKVMRTRPGTEQKVYIQEAARRNQLNRIFEALNVQGRTAWTINKEMLKVVIKLWNTGQNYMSIPPESKGEPKFPERPGKDATPQELRDWARACKVILYEHRNNNSLRCDLNYKLEIARSFVNEKFYFPHNLDFRGRAYPLSPLFNHLGHDIPRSLLKFWRKRELGERGLRWLKIHLANVYGKNKLSFDERVQFVEENLENIFDSADHPLDGNFWWRDADKPFQTLSVCIDLTAALRSPDPTRYKSAIPIHQDGTCNGLQHYAALGGDYEGAQEVNMVQNEKPSDVYSSVAQIVKDLTTVDVNAGNKIAQLVYPFITRKLVKQPVMTNVYGVTFVGARAQILSRLREIPELETKFQFLAANYLTHKVFEAIKTLFKNAHFLQFWLQNSALSICRSIEPAHLLQEYLMNLNNYVNHHTALPSSVSNKYNIASVIWTSPLGLPIVQPYRITPLQTVNTHLQVTQFINPNVLPISYSRKQTNGIAPNFIHSLDATHMFLTAIECGKRGMSFASVHDSYWTHPATVDEMNVNIRESFVKLHSGDLIKKLREEFSMRYGSSFVVSRVNSESEDGKLLKTHLSELGQVLGRHINMFDTFLIETERERLANSNNSNENELASQIPEFPEILSEEKEYFESLKRSHSQAPTHSPTILRSKESSNQGPENYATKLLQDEIKLDGSETSRKGTMIAFLNKIKFPPTPARGSYDVKEVLKSSFFFS